MPNKSNVKASSRLKGWWRFRNEALERVAFIVAIVGFPLLVISTGAVLYQFIEVRHIASSQNYILLSNLFLRDANIAIIDAIEINAIDGKRQILREHGGENTNTRLDNYLGDFDTIDQVYKEGLLTEDQMCRSFSYYVTATLKNEEVKKYMADNPSYFDGIKDLKTAVEKAKEKLSLTLKNVAVSSRRSCDKAAKALGVTIAPSLLTTTDEVIE